MLIGVKFNVFAIICKKCVINDEGNGHGRQCDNIREKLISATGNRRVLFSGICFDPRK